MPRYKVTLEYLGTNYAGFQFQPDQKTVALCLNQAISAFSHEEVNVMCSGRTDKGVHALMQVVHFDLRQEFPPYKIISATNHHLRGEDISVYGAEIVADNFDARRNARARIYEYHILNRKTKPAVFRDLTGWVREDMDHEKMQLAANILVGEHDFSSFRSSECQAKHAFRFIEFIEIKRQGDRIIMRIKGNAFLHNMVRIMVGSLINVATGKWSQEKIAEILAAKDRKLAGPTAPAAGLFLSEIIYKS